ncbi:MAG TPA: TonB-dependent receptor [Acidobacteriaceae bacterium]|nr:TonB-dependent receptor [Acidobacteriaceae bacterium]
MRVIEAGRERRRGQWARRGLAVLVLALLTVAGATVAEAQVLYGTITGNVTDSTGAALGGAQVTAVEAQTGVSNTQTTDASGIYRFPALLPGTYKVTITAQGFTKQETNGVDLRANDIKSVDAQLKIGNVAAEVTVTTAPPILQTDTADVRRDITSHELANLPIMGSQGGNFQELIRTIPGSGLTAETNSLAGNPQRAINANVNGLSNQSINTRLDGVQDAYPYLPANVAYVPPSDAIETVNVVTNSFNAEQGNAGGAAVNVQIKSGTNHYHGDAHWAHTDQNFAARNYFQTDPKLFPKKNRNNQNQFGGAIGGFIKRDKLFFFTDYERTTQRQLAGPDTQTLPTAAMMTGDFRNLPGNPIIYDPATGDKQGAGKTQISCNGVLNVICANRIDPAAQYMTKLLQPLAAQEFTTSNGLNNWVGSSTALFNRDNADGKINYVMSQATMIFGRYSFSKTLVFDPPLLGPAIGNATNGGQLGNAPGLVQSVGLGVTHTFTPSLLIDWNFGFTRQRLGSTFDLTSARGLNDLKIPGTNNAGANGDPSLYYGYPGFVFPTGQAAPNTTPAGSTYGNNLALGNAQPANPFLFRDQQFVTGANMSWNKGKHAFRGGVEWNHTQINHFQQQGGTFQQARGAFEFNGFITDLRGTTPTWFHSWADFLLGLPDATGKARALFNPNALRWTGWAWYVQDHYQVNPKLMLTLGLRWEYYPFGYSDNNKGLRYLNLQTGQVLIGGYGNVPRNDGIDAGIGQFLPRVGVAYTITPTTVFRAGYGMSADPYTWHVLRNAYPSVLLDTNTPANTADYIPAASLTGLNGSALGSGSYSVPTGIVLTPQPNLSSGTIPLPTNVSTTTIPNPINRGYFNSFNAAVEQQMGKNVTYSLAYVGTYAVRPVVNMNANASPPGTGQAGGLLQLKYGDPSHPYSGTINVLSPFKHSRYDSMQTSVVYRFAGGSNLRASYTWSKALSYADNEDLGSLNYPYPTYWYKNYGPAAFDRTDNFELSGVIALPFGKGEPWLQSGVGAAILGGWLINPVVSAMSGVPFTVTASGNLNANGSGQTADLVSNFHITKGRPPRTGVTCTQGDPSCSYFSATSFAAPLITSAANAHYGNTNRDEFRGPGYFLANLSIVRDFKIKERMSLRVRGDAFGLTNTPHFANPNASCPASATVVDPTTGSGQNCSLIGSTLPGSPNNFGIVTGTASPGGFFGPDSGARQLWLGASVMF